MSDAESAGEIDVANLPIEHGVLIGRNDELYLMGGMHWILQFAVGKASISQNIINTFWNNIEIRRRVARKYNCRYLHIIAPEKYVVFPENMPFKARGHMASFIPKEGAPEDVLYPKDVLRSISAGRGYYFTDSHWSVPGKAAIALLIAERAALPDVVIRNGLATLTAAMNGPSTPRFSGDLGRKFTPNRCEAAVSFVLKYNVAIYENGLEHIGGIEYNEGRLTVSISDHSTAADATLLIFGDSYLQQVAVYLGAFFKTVVFCRTRFIHEEMVAMIRPHIIVTENAERYLNSVESDTSAPAFLLMPYLMERKPIFEIGATRAIAAILRSNREV